MHSRAAERRRLEAEAQRKAEEERLGGAREQERERAELEAKQKAEEENRRRIEEEKIRAQQAAERHRPGSRGATQGRAGAPPASRNANALSKKPNQPTIRKK